MEQLKRSSRFRIIGGVAGGLAEYFDIDPLIPRIFFVLSIFWSGAGILIYAILWLVLPPAEAATHHNPNGGQDTGNAVANESKDTSTGYRQEKGTLITGIILIVLGTLFLLEKFIPDFYFRHFWPLLLVIIGIILIINSFGSNREVEEKPADEHSGDNQEEEHGEGPQDDDEKDKRNDSY